MGRRPAPSRHARATPRARGRMRMGRACAASARRVPLRGRRLDGPAHRDALGGEGASYSLQLAHARTVWSEISTAAWGRRASRVVEHVAQVARRTSAQIDLDEDPCRRPAALASLTGGMDEHTDLLVRGPSDADSLAVPTGSPHDVGDSGRPRLEAPDETHDANIDERGGPHHGSNLGRTLVTTLCRL